MAVRTQKHGKHSQLSAGFVFLCVPSICIPFLGEGAFEGDDFGHCDIM